MTALDVALAYIERGWNVVPVKYRTKQPIGEAWQKRVIDAAAAPRHFNGSRLNVGVVLGPTSQGLTDVDLDCAEAIAVAPYVLPHTKAIFGRASKRASHFLYLTDLAVTTEKAAVTYNDPVSKKRILELRIGGDAGAQTVFPGSAHEHGEAIEWEEAGPPTSHDGEDLQQRVAVAAAAALLARHWPGQGARHDCARVIGGFLSRGGLSRDQVKIIVEAVARAARDPEWRDRRQAAEDAAIAHRTGKHAYGMPELRNTFGKEIADRVADWLNYHASVSENEHGGEQHQRADNQTAALTLVRANVIEQLQVDWMWQDRLARGKLTLIAGDPGVGKSQLALNVAARLSKGQPWPDGGTAPIGNSIILSAEDAANDTICPRLEISGADLSKITILESVTEGGRRRSFSIQKDLHQLAQAISQIGNVTNVVVDPITSYMGMIDGHRTTDVRAVLEPFDKFAEACGVSILAITHPPKASQAKAIHSFTGSLAFVAAARLAFVCIEESETDRSLLLAVKNNLGRKAAGLGYRFEQRTTSKGIWASRIAWDASPVTVTANQAIAAAAAEARKGPAIREAETFLREYLADGPMPAEKVKTAAAENEISASTLRRARESLKVTVAKAEFQGPSTWQLPR